MSGVKCMRTSRTEGDRHPRSSRPNQNDHRVAVDASEDAAGARERPMTLADFDKLMYRSSIAPLSLLKMKMRYSCQCVMSSSLSSDVIVDYLVCEQPETPCFPGTPLTDEERMSDQNLWTIMTEETSTCVGSLIKQSEFTLFWWMMHLVKYMLLVGQQTRIDLSLYMYNLIVDDAWSMHGTGLPYGVFMTNFLIDRGVVVNDTKLRTPISSALNKAMLSRSKR
ncbi:hypothetical protein CJ030_MR2G026844 [Morella rubra]|uniref:Uncharacterized protein n=1 Tax=Morella rubra TaxID=262757 RepID=A0A6A1WIQ0_9ROSI|nr:hypothetical protein CJ030_MR2G026844 [Morella rubra]